MVYNEDDRLIRNGRIATTSGLAGGITGIILSAAAHLSTGSGIIVVLLFSYIGLSGYWGASVFYEKSRRYKYRMPEILFRVVQFPIVATGVAIGLIGYGIYEHLILLISIQTRGNIRFAKAQMILTPILGPVYQKSAFTTKEKIDGRE